MLEGYRTARSEDWNRMSEDKIANICGYSAFGEGGDEIGSVQDYVMDETGRLRYLVIDTGFWVFGKKVLVPAGLVDVDDDNERVMLRNLTKRQVEDLPAYDERMIADPRYEERVFGTYFPDRREQWSGTEAMDYDQFEEFNTPERLQLMEERLQVNKRSEKVGEVSLKKRTETHHEQIDVPVTEEQLVIERHPVQNAEAGQLAGEIGESDEITIPLYREEVEVSKRPVVAEEVTVSKERRTEHKTVESDLRNETLDIDKSGNVTVDRGGQDRGQPPR